MASVNRYRIAAANGTSVFVGDPVVLDNESAVEASQLATFGSNQMDGTRYVKQGGAGGPWVGVVIGFAYDPTNLTSSYRVASTDRDVYVVDDPFAIFSIQSDSTGISSANMNMNCSTTAGTGSTTTGLSGFVATAPSSTNTSLPLKIMGYSEGPKNDITSAAYVNIKVLINMHQYLTGTSSAGV